MKLKLSLSALAKTLLITTNDCIVLYSSDHDRNIVLRGEFAYYIKLLRFIRILNTNFVHNDTITTNDELPH